MHIDGQGGGIDIQITPEGPGQRQKTRDSYEYIVRNFETLFGDSPFKSLSGEDIHQFLLIVTDGRARSSARLSYAQLKSFFNYFVENHLIAVNPCDEPTLRKAFRQGTQEKRP